MQALAFLSPPLLAFTGILAPSISPQALSGPSRLKFISISLSFSLSSFPVPLSDSPLPPSIAMAQEGWQLEPENSPCPPSSSPPEAPSLCSNNCGFFGSPATMNLCSACYRELVLLKAQVPASSSPSPSSSSSCSAADVSSSSSCSSASSPLPRHSLLSSSALLADVAPLSLSSSSSSASLSEASASLSSNPNPGKQVNRCLMCRKRVGLTGFKCRCGDLFCALHRYSDKHNCTFDYKAAARQAISKANPVVKAAKVDKI